MIKCTLCGKELPEGEFTPSFIKRGQHQCKKCVYERYGKKAQKKYFNSISELEDKEFDKFCGGYVIKVLNFVRNGEFKYIISSTTGDTFRTNDKGEFYEHISKILTL